MSEMLEKARKYEEEQGKQIKAEDRPAFHISPYIGWMNDPNGFSYYQGEYHLFYQYYPYDTHWDSMHWGHVVSKDLLHWKYLPAALAPDEEYDKGGCFSGSAIELDDGRQLLMYTAVDHETLEDGSKRDIQTQAVAVGDGRDYVKYEKNPVLTEKDLPEGASKVDFRDPKIWKGKDGNFYCVIGSRPADGSGQILLYRSENGFDWEFVSILAENKKRFGKMWECPDFFTLDGQNVLIVSTMEMEAEELEYPNGNGVVCQIGHFDNQTGQFHSISSQSVDYGIDFYAPQTMLAPDGRRILIGWMQNLASVNQHSEKEPWFGQMTIPRELAIKKGRLIQRPVRELDACRHNMVSYTNAIISGEKTLKGVCGRIADIELSIAPQSEENRYYMFEMRFAQDDKHYTSLRYHPHESELELDRSYSGSRIAMVHKRSCKVQDNGGSLKLRVVIDRFSAEVFVNDGEQVMSITFKTDLKAEKISFVADGVVKIDILKYEIK